MIHSVVISLMAFCLLIGLVFVNKAIDERVSDSHEELRLELVDQQWNQIRIQRLNENPVNSLLQFVGEDITSLQVRIAELLTSSISNAENVVRYEQRVLPKLVNHDAFLTVPLHSDIKINIVRLSLTLQISHGPNLLDWLQRVGKGTGGWPSEIRSCDVRKTIPVGLLADCIVDVYHWQNNSNV